jgi:hypothetical protein
MSRTRRGRAALRAHQVYWKEVVRGVLERGTWKGKPARVRFPADRWRENLLPDYVEDIEEHLDRLQIQRHEGIGSTASSQAFTLQLVAPFLREPARMLPILRAILPLDGRDCPAEVTRVEVEYDADNLYLGEAENATRGELRTNSDIAIWWTSEGGARRLLLVEVKYLEQSFGICQTGKGQGGDCDHGGAALSRSWWAACPLHALGRRYWQIARELDIFNQDLLAESGPCAFRHGLYQLMRNQVQASAIEADADSRVDRCDFAILLHPDNESVRQIPAPVAGENDAVKAFHRVLNDASRFLELDARAWLEAGLGETGPAHWAEPLLSRYFPPENG